MIYAVSDSNHLTALHDLTLSNARIEWIMTHELMPLQARPDQISRYAESIVHSQQTLLHHQFDTLADALTQTLHTMMQCMQRSDKTLSPKRYPAWQRWLGIDLEHQAQQDAVHYQLADLTQTAQQLHQQLLNQQPMLLEHTATLVQLRLDMAHYIVAAEQGLTSGFMRSHASPDHTAGKPGARMSTWNAPEIADRLKQRIHTLMTVQTSFDLGIVQRQLAYQINQSVMDRFNETLTVLIPAWQQYAQNQSQQQLPQHLHQLNESRQKLLTMLQRRK